MSAAALIQIRALRTVTLGTRRVLPGSTVHVDAMTAIELIRSGAARLVDESDMALLLEHQRPATRWCSPVTR